MLDADTEASCCHTCRYDGRLLEMDISLLEDQWMDVKSVLLFVLSVSIRAPLNQQHRQDTKESASSPRCEERRLLLSVFVLFFLIPRWDLGLSAKAQVDQLTNRRL